jgi:hypothetical protein
MIVVAFRAMTAAARTLAVVIRVETGVAADLAVAVDAAEAVVLPGLEARLAVAICPLRNTLRRRAESSPGQPILVEDTISAASNHVDSNREVNNPVGLRTGAPKVDRVLSGRRRTAPKMKSFSRANRLLNTVTSQPRPLLSRQSENLSCTNRSPNSMSRCREAL